MLLRTIGRKLPERSTRGGHIQGNKSTNALSCNSLTHFKNILIHETTIQEKRDRISAQWGNKNRVTQTINEGL